MSLPRDAIRRLAGAPIVVDGNLLDAETQLTLEIARRVNVRDP